MYEYSQSRQEVIFITTLSSTGGVSCVIYKDARDTYLATANEK